MRHLYIVTESSSFLLENSEARTVRTLTFSAERGEIKDRNDMPLALELPYYRLKVLSDLSASEATKISQILGIKEQILHKALQQKKTYLPYRLSAQQKMAIQTLGSEKVEVEKRPGRYYPLGQSAAPVVGLLGFDGVGMLGAEYQFNRFMTGQTGSMHYSQNLLGQVHEVYENNPAQQGHDLYLTIDARIQQLGWDILKQAVQYHQAEAASAVVLDVKTGDVLALLNYPSFDPNQKLARVGPETKNQAISDLFEPGSIIKPLVMAAILTHSSHDMNEEIQIPPEGLNLGGKLISDHQYFESVRFEDVLLKSSNIAMVRLAQSLPKDALIKCLDKLGLFHPSYIALPGEVAGRYQGQGAVETATMSYGYGLAVNLISMANAYNVIANRGHDVGVHILKNALRTSRPSIIKPEVCDTITSMMQRVVDYGVSSRRAAIEGMSVAGKSGTTRLLSKQGEYESSYLSSFAGFAPAHSPRVVVAVMVKKPTKHGYYGGRVAAPIFSELAKVALHYQSMEGLNAGDQRLLSSTTE